MTQQVRRPRAPRSTHNSASSARRFRPRRLGLEALDGRLLLSSTPVSMMPAELGANSPLETALQAAQLAPTTTHEPLSASAALVSRPAAPTNLHADQVGSRTADLHWTDRANNETTYRIAISRDGGTSWDQLGTVGANVTTFQVINLSPHTRYLFRVRAANSAGFSDFSTALGVTTAEEPPSSPTNLRVDQVGSRTVELRWTDRANNETTYRIAISRDGGTTWDQLGTVGPNVTTFQVTNLPPHTRFLFRVRAANSAGFSDFTAALAVTTAEEPPLSPTNLRADQVGSRAVDLRWTDRANNETEYRIAISRDGGVTWDHVGTVGANATTFHVANLNPHTRYQFHVRAANAAGFSDFCTMLDLTTADVPPLAPANLRTDQVESRAVDLRWTDRAGNETEYRIAISRDGGRTWDHLGTVKANVTTFHVANLNPHTSYQFRVRAANSAGLSDFTDPLKVSTRDEVLAPTNLRSGVSSSTSIELRWTDNATNETGYQVQYRVDGGNWVDAAMLTANRTTYTVDKLAPNTHYSFRVRARGSVLASNWSNECLATTSNTFLKLGDATLAELTQRLFADGSISRADMLQILRSVGRDDQVVDRVELADLTTILRSENATLLKIPDYVQVLARDVVQGNAANAHFQGQWLGNLAAGASNATLDKLIGKWFLGSDHPVSPETVYRAANGSLFVQGPAYTDMHQGAVGDCYFIAALGALATSSPASIQNMFIDNSDGTFTVRFYDGSGTADYVTVDRQLPTYPGTGRLVYANAGSQASASNNELWLALAEKAYVQWNETGKAEQDGTNRYAGIAGGWTATVNAQVLGHASQTSWKFDVTAQQTVIAAVQQGWAVTAITVPTPGLGLVGPHAYVVTGYNPLTARFTLYNPWGTDHPAPLTWQQLGANCQCLVWAGGTASRSLAASTVPTSIALAPLPRCAAQTPFESPAALTDATAAKADEPRTSDQSAATTPARWIAQTDAMFHAFAVESAARDDDFWGVLPATPWSTRTTPTSGRVG